MGFNLRREANPLATQMAECGQSFSNSFNLRREANPLATVQTSVPRVLPPRFQSQARSQSPGDVSSGAEIPMMPDSFNLRREANPLATRGEK